MTTPDEPPQVPIVPGRPPEPPPPAYEPPTQAYPPAEPGPPQVYYQQPTPAAPAQPSDWRPGRVAGNTVVVVLTIVGIVIGVPLLCCGFWLVLGLFTEGLSGGN